MGTQDNESLLARLGGRAVVGQIRQQLDELAAARDQLELLLQVVTDISSELDLQATLRRIVGAAIRLTGARYGAVGVRADDGTLAAFLHEGVPSETACSRGFKMQHAGRPPAAKSPRCCWPAPLGAHHCS